MRVGFSRWWFRRRGERRADFRVGQAKSNNPDVSRPAGGAKFAPFRVIPCFPWLILDARMLLVEGFALRRDLFICSVCAHACETTSFTLAQARMLQVGGFALGRGLLTAGVFVGRTLDSVRYGVFALGCDPLVGDVFAVARWTAYATGGSLWGAIR